MPSTTITYAIDLESPGPEGYFVAVWVGGDLVERVGPIGDREMAERVQDETAARLRTVLEENKARIVRQFTSTKAV